jgi:membrane protein implicated in regulation of membrane protease activity
MRAIKGFLLFWYDFIVGDDVTIAIGVVIALAVTALLAHNGVAAWWLLPVAVAILLGSSLVRVVRAGRRQPRDGS